MFFKEITSKICKKFTFKNMNFTFQRNSIEKKTTFIKTH